MNVCTTLFLFSTLGVSTTLMRHCNAQDDKDVAAGEDRVITTPALVAVQSLFHRFSIIIIIIRCSVIIFISQV